MENVTQSNVSDIQIFKNAQFGQIRTSLSASNEPLFCLADICKAIGVNNPRMVRNRLDDGDVSQIDTLTTSGTQSITYVTESGMYDVIIRSDSKKAKPFRKWVTSEVLPTIRKTGGYMVSKQDDTPEMIMARALMIAQDTINRTKQQLEQMRPAAMFAKAVETSSDSILVGDLARIIKQNGVEIGQNRLFEWMRKNGFLICRHGESYNMPTQRGLNQGLFEIKKTVITKPNGESFVITTPKVTGKGQIFFVNRFLYMNENKIGAEF